MKKIALLLFFVPLFSLAQSEDLKHYGEKISSQNTVTLEGLINHAKEKLLLRLMELFYPLVQKKDVGCRFKLKLTLFK